MARLQADWLLGHFGTQRIHALAQYVEFVRVGIGVPSIWDDLRGQIFLGNESFAATVRSRVPIVEVLTEVPHVQRRHPAQPISHYATGCEDRHRAMALAYLCGDHTMRAGAEHFGVHYVTVSRAVRAYELSEQHDGYPFWGEAD